MKLPRALAGLCFLVAAVAASGPALSDNGFTGNGTGGGSSGGGPVVTGTGFAHVTTGVFDGTADIGTAGQFALTNAGATDRVWSTITGDVGASTVTPGLLTVNKVHGATVPAAGSLTTGNGLYVSASSALSYSALNLAGGGGWVTGMLPLTNQAAPTSTGLAHITSGSWDGAAYSLQASDLPTISLSGDVSCSGNHGSLSSCNVGSISGSSPIAITPNNLQWVAGASPLLSQAAAVSGSGTNMVFAPQVSTTSGNNGFLELDISAPSSGTVEAGYMVKRAGTVMATLQPQVSTPANGAVYLGTAANAPTSTNWALNSTGSVGALNGSTASTMGVAGTAYFEAVGNILEVIKPIGGVTSGIPYVWANTTSLSLSGGGTVSLTNAQLATPAIQFTGSLPNDTTVAIGGHAGFFALDFSGVTLNAHNIIITNGVGTFTATTLLGTKTLLFVNCFSTSTLTVGMNDPANDNAEPVQPWERLDEVTRAFG